MRVGIVGRKDNPRAASVAGDVRERLRDLGVEALVDSATADQLAIGGVDVDEMAGCDLVVSIGGDGTFLFAARAAGATPIMGVNLGEVGFLNAVSPPEAVEAVEREVERIRETGAPRIQELPRLCATGEGWGLPPALNEVAVLGAQRGHGHGIDAEVRIDGALYAGGHADGVLVATPSGSTAYNLSEGGPLVHPDVGGMVVTEMAAQETMPPLVVGIEREVAIRVDAVRSADAGDPEGVAVSDGRATTTFEAPARVTVRRADEPVRIAGPTLDFFAALGKLD